MTPSDLLVEAERQALMDNAVVMGWTFERDGAGFVLGLPAKDGCTYYLRPDLTGYPATPPAWHWFNPTTGAIDAQIDTPVGGNFLHGHGVICAPWNRLAYQSVDSRGPHGEWQIGAWQQNSYTGACVTLSAMALRIAFELKHSLQRRLAAA